MGSSTRPCSRASADTQLEDKGLREIWLCRDGIVVEKGLVGLRRKELAKITPEGYKRPQRDRTLSEEGLKIK